MKLHLKFPVNALQHCRNNIPAIRIQLVHARWLSHQNFQAKPSLLATLHKINFKRCITWSSNSVAKCCLNSLTDFFLVNHLHFYISFLPRIDNTNLLVRVGDWSRLRQGPWSVWACSSSRVRADPPTTRDCETVWPPTTPCRCCN